MASASKFVQYDRAALTELLTVKKQCQRISWQRMNKITCALQSRYTSSAKLEAKHMFSYLDLCCYFEANGQNHIHFRPIQVLKNSMAWHFLTFRSLCSQLEFVYPPLSFGVRRVIAQFLVKFNAWTSQRLLKSNPQVNHRIHLKDSYVS